MKNKEYSLILNWNYIGISVIIFTILTVLVLYLPSMREIDTTILKSIRLALSPFPSYIPVFVCEFGRANCYLWPQITTAAVLVSHRLYMKAFMLVLFVQVSIFLKDLVKDYVCRPRPEVSSLSGFSFPSGHSCVTMCLLGISIYLVNLYVKSGFWRNFLIALFSLWIFLVGIARMWLGAHFFTDIIAGMLLGFLLVNLYIIVDKLLNR